MVTKIFRATFEIAEDISCPLYEKGERMVLSDRTFSCPEGKEVCLILVRDMTQLLFGLLKEQKAEVSAAAKLYSCSGCTGLIKFRRLPMEAPAPAAGTGNQRIETKMKSIMQEVHGRSVESDFLKAIPADKVEAVIRKFQEVEVPAGRVLVHQGEPNPNLYLVMTGSFAVENQGQQIATLSTGELFGEMSYLGIEPAVASIKALTNSTVLGIRTDEFSKLLSAITAVQNFMARLLANRLQQINLLRIRDFEYAMRGKIADVLPAELLQVFHMHQKSGRLVMDLAGGKARVSFREGRIVNAQYDGKKNEEAIFSILAEKKGYYRFTAGLPPQEMNAQEIGDFMGILMEGIKRVDEDNPERGDDFAD